MAEDQRGTSYEGRPPPGAKPSGRRRVALVVGNGSYLRSSDVLANPPNDARDIAEALTRIGFAGVAASGDEFAVDFARAHVPPLLDLDQQGLGRALAALARASDGVEQAVIYYAGHGIEVGGENYLIPVDARLDHAKDADFELQPLSRALRTIEGAIGLRLIILDACRNNPFRSRLFGARDMSAGLRAFEPPGNVMVAYSAKHGTVAFDGRTDAANSPFAKALLSHIETPGLEVVDLFREVKDDVLDATEGAQEPYLYGSLGRNREYFVPAQVENGHKEKSAHKQQQTTALSVDEGALELEYWKGVNESDMIQLEEFLQLFPSGLFAKQANSALRRAVFSEESVERLREVLTHVPHSPRWDFIDRQLAGLWWAQIAKTRKSEQLESFLEAYPDHPKAGLARSRLEMLRRREQTNRRPILLAFVAGFAVLVVVAVIWSRDIIFRNPLDRLTEHTQPVEESKRTPSFDERLNALLVRLTDNDSETRDAARTGLAELVKPELELQLVAIYFDHMMKNPDYQNRLGILKALQRIDGGWTANKAQSDLLREWETNLPEKGDVFRRSLAGALRNMRIASCSGVEVAIAGGGKQCLDPEDKNNREFQDCFKVKGRSVCAPRMVVVPAGSFTMGSPKGEAGRDDDEAQVPVRIGKPFAVGTFEVTTGEYLVCAAAGKCRPPEWQEPGSEYNLKTSAEELYRGVTGDRQPIVGISWYEAVAYAKWLSTSTGKPYRLLSEAEWEYAARADTATAYFWGDTFESSRASNHRKTPPVRGYKTLPVGRYKANAWGLHDMHGNLWEWTLDCWNSSNIGNPGNGTARTIGDCRRRVVRGGSWIDDPVYLRSASRSGSVSSVRGILRGFRVARTLNP